MKPKKFNIICLLDEAVSEWYRVKFNISSVTESYEITFRSVNFYMVSIEPAMYMLHAESKVICYLLTRNMVIKFAGGGTVVSK